ncbi:MAG: ABC transporter substrate-binding protein [Gammaproteobacteria bacterium]|nr:ABC transporter substrate-binding protein [Gammaproteobacteria bacterium]
MRIKQTVDEVLEVLRSPDLDRDKRRDMVRIIVRPRFDYRAMSQIILAQNWRKASAEQQDRFIYLFRDLLEHTYFSAMDKYTGETVRMGREKLSDKRAVVQTYISTSSKEVPVNYNLRLKNDDWYAYDVSVDGVSLVSNYRTSFRNLVREKGMDGLLEELERKVESLKTVTTESEVAGAAASSE